MSRLDPTVWAGEPEVSGVDGLLIDLPHRGNRLIIACRHCGHQASISGRDICLRFTAFLAAPVEEWAAALSCGQCRSRWTLVSCENDSAAQGFNRSTQDNGQMIWARRLAAYLAEAGTSIEAFKEALAGLADAGRDGRTGARGGQFETAADPVRNRRLVGKLLVERPKLPSHRSLRLAPTPQWANAVSGSNWERAMPIKKTDLKARAGVKLTLVEEVTPVGTVRSQHYRLTTLRPNQPRVLARQDLAEEAFDLEVVASLLDPVVQRMTGPN